MALTYVRDLDPVERMFYTAGTCVQYSVTIEGNLDQDIVKSAYARLLKAYPALRSCIVGDGSLAAFYLNDVIPKPYFSERENIDEFFEVSSILHTSGVIRCDYITNHQKSIISLTIHHAIADGIAGYAYFYMFAELILHPELELTESPFPYGVQKIIDDIKPQGTDLSLIFEFLPTLPLSPTGVPVNWDSFYPATATNNKFISFTQEETKKIIRYAKSIGATVNSLVYSAILLSEYHLFGTDDHKKWAGVQLINYRSRLSPMPAPTDGTNIIAWLPEFIPVNKTISEKDLCLIVKQKLTKAIETGSALNGTVNFSFMMNLAPQLKKLQTITPARAAALVSNLGVIPIMEAPFKVLDYKARPLSVGPRLFYFVYSVFDKLTIGLSYPSSGFYSEKDIDLVYNEIYHRLTQLK